ncbi:MAG: methyltransferase domain-containing protein [Magnetococcales bacterium]|nr:methyltransferase domain-containing protein [Magnetococcales bacterium]
MIRSRRVAESFGAAATRYEDHAPVQAHAARRLAQHLATLSLPEAPRILEIGCGSGLLSRHLLRLFPTGHFLLTDLSFGMLQVARTHLDAPPGGRLSLAVMDGEALAVAGGFDLIVSGLTWQWFRDPMASFARAIALLNPGGWLVVSTLGAENFPEWRALCAAARLPHGMPDYPSCQDWEKRLAPEGKLEEEWFPMAYDSALAFLQSLRALGAHQPAAHHRPVPGGALRRVLRPQETGFLVRYRLLYIRIQS